MNLLGWLGIEGTFAIEEDAARLPHSPAAIFDEVSSARWVASYLLEQGSGLMLPRGGIDVMLISPHPAAVDEPAIWAEMLDAARSEGRERIAVIVPDVSRFASLTATSGVTHVPASDAIRRLSANAVPWDAIIVTPDLRQSLFSLLARIAAVRGPWPMVLHDPGSARISMECEGDGDLPLDMHCLVQSLALALRQAGRIADARRLHDAWARLRDTGITTPGRGCAGPYAKVLSDRDCIAMICKGYALSRRDVPGWKALSSPMPPLRGSQTPALRIVRKGAVFP